MLEADQDANATETTVNDGGDDYIIPPDTQIVEEGQQPPQATTEHTKEENSDVKDTEESSEGATQATEVVEEELDEATRKEIMDLGKYFWEYQKERPGFDVKELHKEFTRKSMKLAETERKLELYEKSEPQTNVEEDPLTDIAEGDVKLIERVLRAKGYVKRDEVEPLKAQSRQTQEQTIINTFIAEHPEYSDAQDPEGARWNALMAEFKLFDKTTRENPEKTLDLLKRAHRIVTPPAQQRAETIKQIAEQKRNRLGQQSSEGSSGKAPAPTTDTQVSPKHAQLLANLKGFSDEQKANILKRLNTK